MITPLGNRSGRSLLVEIALIVVGINVALWFEGWFEDRREREDEQQYLVELRGDLERNVVDLDKVIVDNAAKAERLKVIVPQLAALADAPPQQQAQTIFEPSSYSFFTPSDETYQSMLESGDFRLISDRAIKKDLLALSRRWQQIDTLQGNYLQALDDEYIPLMMRGFDLVAMRVADPEMLSDQTFRNFFPYALQDTERLVWSYESAREQALGVMAEIDAAIGPDVPTD